MLPGEGFMDGFVDRNRRLPETLYLSENRRTVTFPQGASVDHAEVVKDSLPPLKSDTRLVETALPKHLYRLVAEADVDGQRVQRRILEHLLSCIRWQFRVHHYNFTRSRRALSKSGGRAGQDFDTAQIGWVEGWERGPLT